MFKSLEWLNRKVNKSFYKNMAATLLDKDGFFKKYNIEADALEKTALNWSDLDAIYTDHKQNVSNLQPTANFIADSLRQVSEVHSLRIRIKDPEHLIEKIIRKKLENNELEITLENYKEVITDLVGVRALHLFKEDWNTIHDYIEKTWELKEQPTANVRKGDSEDYTEQFRVKGCSINEHKFGYRSVHYLILFPPSKQVCITELQVRTIFEEGWSEIDHSVRYPYDLENVILAQVSAIHNRLAGSADEIGSFIRTLKKELQDRDERYTNSVNEHEKLLQELNGKIETLQISEAQKRDLENDVKSLSSTSILRFRLPNAEMLANAVRFAGSNIEQTLLKTLSVSALPGIIELGRTVPIPKNIEETSPTSNSAETGKTTSGNQQRKRVAARPNNLKKVSPKVTTRRTINKDESKSE